ncbi:MAG: helix-turn-helix domain-containing protein [Armatimonadota bacterium]
MSRILTVEQVAEKLQMTTDVIREYLRKGKIPGRKVGKAWRVVETDLENWVSNGQAERSGRVSGYGFLAQFPGGTSSEEFMSQKHAETDEEERRSEERGKKTPRTGEAA